MGYPGVREGKESSTSGQIRYNQFLFSVRFLESGFVRRSTEMPCVR